MKYSGFEKEEHFDRLSFYNGDCMDLLKQTPDKYYDLALVDPPYGINVNVSMGRRKGDKKSDYHKFAGGDTSTLEVEYFEELKRVSKNQIIFGANYFMQTMCAAGFYVNTPCWILWDKGFSENVTFAQFEMAWTSFSSSSKKYDFNAAANNDRIHPTQKPVQLYEWIINKYANENFKILDTHLGSGSIAIAIDKANTLDKKNLTFVGIELDPDYFQAAVERFKNHKRQCVLSL